MSRRFRLHTSHAFKASAARINFNKSELSLWGSRGYDRHGESGRGHQIRQRVRRESVFVLKPPETLHRRHQPVAHWFVAVFSGGPTSLAQVRPGITILVALRMEHLRTRIFRGIELQDHPLGIRNAGVRYRV